MPNESNRNLIVFGVIAAAVLMAYQYFVINPSTKKRLEEQKKVAAAAPATAAGQGAVGPDGKPAPIVLTQQQAMGPAELRHPIVTHEDPASLAANKAWGPVAVTGSLSLRGGRIDDLSLANYHQGLDRTSPAVRLLSPAGAENAWYTRFGWAGQNVAGLPDDNTVWTLQSGDTLTEGHPVVMTYTSPQNLVFTRVIEVDAKYMFKITDTVVNKGAGAVALTPYAQVQRQGLPKTANGQPPLGGNSIVLEGAIGAFGADGKQLHQLKYPAWLKKTEPQTYENPVWLGITDKYWLVALAPKEPKAGFTGRFASSKVGGDGYQTSFNRTQPVLLQPGQTTTQSTLMFAGAKTVPTLKAYQKDYGLTNFDNAVDWGMFWFLTRPFFMLLEFLKSGIGSFGLAILALTVTVRLVLFPLANKSYESMTKMKKLQPQLEELKVKFKDDPAKQQQEMMAIYAREKINPMMGCLPMLLQIPVFFSVYKVLSVTIEMRHTPFLGWIKDLSGQDPTTIWNLFGLIPWHPDQLILFGNAILAGHLHLGVLPLLYGFTMWLTTAMNPPAPDPMQQRIFQLMPIMFTFIMATFPVGLLIYWTWSNVLSILQQYVIMHRLEVDNPIDGFIKRVRGIGHHAETV